MATRSPTSGLKPYACDPARSRGRLVTETESPTRSVFQRDRDRIIHAGAFRKLKYKTQVFLYHEGDYYRTRLTHSLEVAQITRSVCRYLGLNEDLGEAIALAHDLGHTPFGHAGEQVLAECMAPYGGFDHNDQTLRVLTLLERRYVAFDGLNLTWEALEGVVKHNGPLLPAPPEQRLPPSIAAFQQRWDLELDSYASLEAQLAALADDIAYSNHDLDDGLRAGLFTLEEIAALALPGPVIATLRRNHPGLEQGRLVHETIRHLINVMVTDLITETERRLATLRPRSADAIRRADQPVAAFSAPVRRAVEALRTFLFDRMYRFYRVNRVMSKSKRVVRALFDIFMAEPNTLPTDWQEDLRTLGGLTDEAVRARLVADYIAGMTDRYALVEHERLFDVSARS